MKTNGTNGKGKMPKESGNGTSAKLQKLFEDSLKDIYWAEKALTKALPKMAKNATNEDLKDALEGHLQETQGHVKRLEEAFEKLGKPATAKKCEAMAGLIEEGDEMMQENENGEMRDAGIILAGQKVEHYEIATYGTLRASAEILGHDQIAGLLGDTLEEEKAADEKLTEVTKEIIHLEPTA